MAFVQTYTTERDGTLMLFKAQVKFNKTGACTVRAGFMKGGVWHVGGFSNRKFYSDEYIRGTGGDTVFVTIKALEPPLNTSVSVEILP